MATIALAACAPPLNWREVAPEGAGVRMLFPCRPTLDERPVRIAGETLRMRLHSCSAAGALFSLSVIDVAEAARVGVVLQAMRAAAVANLNGTATTRPFGIAGATLNEASGRLRVEGRLQGPDAVIEHAAFFVRGLRLYQATALGGPLDDDALDTFFSSIRIGG